MPFVIHGVMWCKGIVIEVLPSQKRIAGYMARQNEGVTGYRGFLQMAYSTCFGIECTEYAMHDFFDGSFYSCVHC